MFREKKKRTSLLMAVIFILTLFLPAFSFAEEGSSSLPGPGEPGYRDQKAYDGIPSKVVEPIAMANDIPATFINVSITSDSAYEGGQVMTYGNSVILSFESTADLFPGTKPVVDFQIGGRNVSEAVPFVTEVAPNKFEAAFKFNFSDHRTGSDTTYAQTEPERNVDFGGIGGPVTFSITGIGPDGLDIAPVTGTSDGSSLSVNQALPSIPDAPVVSPTKDLEDPYWDDATYAMIEKTVMDNVPFFLEGDSIPQFKITDAKYADLVRTVNESNASGGGTTPRQDYTQVFKAAIAEANAVGTGAKVVVPYVEGGENVYYTGAISLLSNVNLVVEEGATLKFLRIISSEFYPIVLQSFEGQDLYNYSPPVYALKQKNIAITGGGTIDAQFSGGWSTRMGDKMALNKDSDRNVPAVKRIYTDSQGPTAGVMPTTIPVIDGGEVKWIAPPASAVNNRIGLRPCFVQPYDCENIIIKGISIRGTPMWNIAPISCENVLVDGLDINAVGIGNGDGVNPISTKFVIIQNVKFATGDDCIAIKSFKNGDGLRRNEPSQYIIVRDCDFANGHGGVTCGSEISGGIRWVFAERNNFDSTSLEYALRFKVNSFRGATIENIYERDSSITRCATAVLYIESSYTSGNAQDRVGDLGRYTPRINNIYISDFTTAGGAEAGNINCTNLVRMTAYTRSPINSIHIRDCEFYGTGVSTVESLAGWELINVKTSAKGVGNPVTTLNSIPARITDVKLSNGTDTVALKDTLVSGNNSVSVIGRSGIDYTITGKVETAYEQAPTVRIYTGTAKTGGTVAIVNCTPAEEGGYNFTAGLTIPENNSAYYINATAYLGTAPAANASASANLNQTTAVHNVVFADDSVLVDLAVQAIEGGTYAIPYAVRTNQDTRNAWVQSEVNALIPSGNGSTAVVTYDNGYVVSVSKGTVTKLAAITVTESGLNVTTTANLVKKGEYFDVTASLPETTTVNAVSFVLNYDPDKFEYCGNLGADPAQNSYIDGVTYLTSDVGDGNVKLTLMIPDYKAKDLVSLRFRAKENADIQNADNSITATADLVYKTPEGSKFVFTVSGSTEFTSSGNPGDTDADGKVTLLDLSNVIDMFGVKSGDALWTKAKFYDFNKNKVIDIADIVTVAKLIF